MKYEITECREVDPRLVESVARLLPQFSSSAAIPDAEHLRRIVDARATTLLLARAGDTGEILGMLTLLLFVIPSAVRAQIHDVVVDEHARGHGIAEALVRRALDMAKNAGAKNVDLTSRPARVAANRLYPRLGFARHETNLYRYTFEP